jgi:hypothetical protein
MRPAGPTDCSPTCRGGVLARGGLEELDRVAGWVVEQDLLTTGAPDDDIAALQSRGAEPLDLGEDVLNDEVDAVLARGVQKPGSRSGSGVGTEIDSFGVP